MKVFLDCGSNIGQGYLYFRQIYGDDCHYILFEPNPNCYMKLIEQFDTLPNVDIHNEAVYIENCIKPFKFTTKYSVGGSLIENHNSAYSVENKQEVLVNCVDIVEIIEKLSLNSEIIVKFDIESSEYDVLEKMISFETIFKVKKIYCEFHSQYMNNKDKKVFNLREKKIMEFISHNNVDFEVWH